MNTYFVNFSSVLLCLLLAACTTTPEYLLFGYMGGQSPQYVRQNIGQGQAIKTTIDDTYKNRGFVITKFIIDNYQTEIGTGELTFEFFNNELLSTIFCQASVSESGLRKLINEKTKKNSVVTLSNANILCVKVIDSATDDKLSSWIKKNS